MLHHLGHVFRQAIPAECNLLLRRLESAFIAGSNRERVIVEVRAELLALEVSKPFGEVWEELGGRVVVVVGHVKHKPNGILIVRFVF